MDKNELARRLMATFLEELHEHDSALSDNLLALEKQPSAEERSELLRSLFRSAHSLKGAAQAVNVGLIETACHQMEDMLSAVRDDRLVLTADLCSLLLQTVDAIEEAGMRLREKQDLDQAPLGELIPQLKRAAAGKFVADSTQTTSANGSVVTTPEAPLPTPEVRTEVASATESLVAAIPAPAELRQPAPMPKVATEKTSPVASEPAPSALSVSATIRVHAEKLDVLLAQSGELLVARRRVESRPTEIATLRDTVAGWRTEWRRAEKRLRQLTGDKTAGPLPSLAARPRLPHRIAALLDGMGDRLLRLEKDLDQLATRIAADSRLLGQTCDTLDDQVHRIRMLPFVEACSGLERAVRDLSVATGKDVALVLEGQDVEVDRSVLEGLKSPLLHLLRNAVDHGVEPPEEREANGKSRRATVTVSAALHGAHVDVIVADDGRGFDLNRIWDNVRQRGLPEPQDERELVRMVFMPGFSTAPIVTDVSGRGVGLDVVQSQIESLHGAVDVTFEPGAGTCFTLRVPLTLTTIRCVLVAAGGQTYAIATGNVQRLVRFDADRVRRAGGRDVLPLGDSPIPIVRLAETLGQAEPKKPEKHQKDLAIVLSASEQHVAFVVDEVLAEQEVLVKTLGTRIRRVKHVSGATLLPSGRVALVLHVTNVVRTALGRTPRMAIVPTPEATGSAPTATQAETKPRLLVVDDSVTTRTLMKTILESAGYDVTTAVDGQQAWERLTERPVDVVITDVDMPRMDGFDLTATIRGSDAWSDMPVVLVTARETDADKTRGIQVGANAYLAKGSFDQGNLLETIEQLL